MFPFGNNDIIPSFVNERHEQFCLFDIPTAYLC